MTQRGILITALIVFVAALGVMWLNAAPTVTFHDSGEFAMAAASGGIPHPPGAPTWTILATLFVKIGHFHDPARGTNLFSGLWAALTLALLCGLTQVWVSLAFPKLSRWGAPAAGLTSVLILMHSTAFLEQSFTTEQYTLMTALMVAILASATSLVLKPRASMAGVLGLLWGLAIANHPSQITLGLLVLWAVLAGSKQQGFLKLAGACAAGLFAGLMVFLWLPIRSHANPIMDWGNVETWDRFKWAILRKQWGTRPMSQAPPNLLGEWFASYDPLGQLGIVGLLLGILGIFVLVKKQMMWLGWLAAAVIPYAVLMLIGHLKQANVNLDYIVEYGVTDWHLPIYLGFAAGASMGMAFLADRRRIGTILAAVLIGVLLITAGMSVRRASLRNYQGASDYIADFLRTLPDDAVIAAAQDNNAFMLGYDVYFGHPGTKRLVVARSWTIASRMHQPDYQDLGPSERKLKYLKDVNDFQERQPFRLPDSAIPKGNVRIFCDYIAGSPNDARYMVPAGWLFEFMGRPVTNAEVVEADARWRKRFPDLYRKPRNEVPAIERKAWARSHESRGLYFAQRKLWPQAAESFRQGLDWSPKNPIIWFELAYSQEQAGRYREAAESYKQAIMIMPTYVEAIHNLALLYAKAGYYPEAESLLIEELRLRPGDKKAQEKLAQVRRSAQVRPGLKP